MAQSFSHTELAEILGMKPTTLYTLSIKNPKVIKQINLTEHSKVINAAE